MTVARAYAKAQNETASKERLMVLLFQAALRHMHGAARHFQEKRPGEGIALTAKAQEIVTELLATLDARQAPELAGELTGIYTFVIDRLLRGMTLRDPVPVQEAIRAFNPICQAFAEAVQNLERGAAAPAP